MNITSAIFNILLIPAISILAAEDGEGNKVESFSLDRKVLARDTFWLLTVESLFIYFLGMDVFTLSMAVVLVAIYGLYVAHVIYDSKNSGETPEGFDFEELDHTETHKSIAWIGKALDFNKHLFQNKEYTTKSAVIVGLLSCAVIGVSCHYLAISTEMVSNWLGFPVVLGAAVFASAATSLPDTLLSVGAAKDGEGNDAVANAVGSNIFDTSFAVGLPLVIALSPIGEWLFGINLSDGIAMAHGDMFKDTVRYFVLGSSALAALGLIVQANNICKKTAYFLLSLYGLWIAYLLYFVIA